MSSTNRNSFNFVSIIIPVKNEEQHIARCLNAVTSLDYPRDKHEIIVVDNNSSDTTKEIVNKYENVVLLEKEKGTIGAVRNFGAKHAKGNFLAFLDGDCVPDSSWLQVGCNYLMNDERIGCVGFAISKPNADSSWVEKTWYKMGSSSKHKETCTTRWLSSFNLLLRKDLFNRIGGFDEDLETCEDADFGYRLDKISSLIFSDEIFIKHLGNTKTLRDFFLKELWRGKGNLKSFYHNKNKLRNIPSVFIPVIYLTINFLLILLLFLWMLNIKQRFLIYSSVFMIFFFPFFLSLIKKRSNNIIDIFKMTVLYSIYLFARGLAVFGLQTRDKT